MFKKIINVSILIPLAVLSVCSCSKIDETNPYNGRTTAIFNPDVTYGTMTDQDGNIYKTVTIGTQTWMAENLRTTKYNDGTAIPNVTDSDEWEGLITGAYCNNINTIDLDTIATYGRLYNWNAVKTGFLAPIGWHVPSDAEWSTLIDYLGGEDLAGGKLKETGETHWDRCSAGTTNESGFTALPGGTRNSSGKFYPFKYEGAWWCSTERSTGGVWNVAIEYSGSYVYLYLQNKNFGNSVRCVKDY